MNFQGNQLVVVIRSDCFNEGDLKLEGLMSINVGFEEAPLEVSKKGLSVCVARRFLDVK